MAHELATNALTGQSSFLYNAQDDKAHGAPWHRLGIAVDGTFTAKDAIDKAGMGYTVDQWPVFAANPADPSGAPALEIPTHLLNVRRDTRDPLGLVSSSYKVIQNYRAFEFLDEMAAGGEVAYHTAGVLGLGERVWMLAKLPDVIRIGQSDDTVEKFLLLYNSHDGSSALRCLWTPTRVVCWNTASAALKAGEGTGITIRHTGEIEAKIVEAQRVLGIAGKYFAAWGEGANFMAGYNPSKEDLDKYFRALYPDPARTDPGRTKAVRMSLFGLFEQGIGQDMPGVKGTAWAAYNAVTEYIDHHTGTDERRRMESSWYGDGAKVKIKAFDLAVQMAGGGLN